MSNFIKPNSGKDKNLSENKKKVDFFLRNKKTTLNRENENNSFNMQIIKQICVDKILKENKMVKKIVDKNCNDKLREKIIENLKQKHCNKIFKNFKAMDNIEKKSLYPCNREIRFDLSHKTNNQLIEKRLKKLDDRLDKKNYNYRNFYQLLKKISNKIVKEELKLKSIKNKILAIKLELSKMEKNKLQYIYLLQREMKKELIYINKAIKCSKEINNTSKNSVDSERMISLDSDTFSETEEDDEKSYWDIVSVLDKISLSKIPKFNLEDYLQKIKQNPKFNLSFARIFQEYDEFKSNKKEKEQILISLDEELKTCKDRLVVFKKKILDTYSDSINKSNEHQVYGTAAFLGELLVLGFKIENLPLPPSFDHLNKEFVIRLTKWSLTLKSISNNKKEKLSKDKCIKNGLSLQLCSEHVIEFLNTRVSLLSIETSSN